MDYNEEEGQRRIAEFNAKLAARTIKATYTFATMGSKTAQGGEVVSASTGMVIDGHGIPYVGDVVRYPDGTESKIVSGAGIASVVNDRPLALIGSATDNGDTIITSLQNGIQICEYDDEVIPGLLVPGYVPQSVEL